MPNITITQLPAAGPLTGTELVPIVQNGQTLRTTTQAISQSPSLTQTFLTLNQEPTLVNSRALSGGTGVGLTDGGALSTLQIALNGASGSLELASTGLVVKTGASSVTARSIAVSGTGLAITDGDGVSGNPTLSLNGLIAAIAQIGGTGLVAVQNGTTAGGVLIAGTANQINVANGNGQGGNPTISMVSDPVIPGTGGMVIPVGTSVQEPVGTQGQLRFNSTTQTFDGYSAGQWRQFSLSGGVSSFSAGSTGLTPAVATTGGIVLGGILNPASGGTGVNNGTYTTTLAGNVSLGGALTTDSSVTVSGAHSLTLSLTGPTSLTLPTSGTIVTTDAAQTLTNKTISGLNNTLSDIGNSSLVNSSITINGSNVSLGGSVTVTSTLTNALTAGTGLQYNSGTTFDGSVAKTMSVDTAVVATLTGTQTLTNKTISGASNTLSNIPNSALDNSSVTIGTTSISLGSSSLTLGGLTSVAVTQDPTSPLQLATKQYVDAVAEGLHIHASCAAATTGTLASITGGTVTYNNGSSGVGATLTLSVALTTLDGYSLQNGDRILVKNEATQANNGIYTWATGGTVLTRATDFDTAIEMASGDFTFVVNGTLYGNTGWVQTDPVTTVGTSPVVWVQFSGAGAYTAGTGLTLTGTQFSLTSPVAIALGGTNGTAAPTAGGVAYGSGTAYAFTAAGTAGQVLVSNGAGAPTWSSAGSVGVTSLSFGTTGLTPSTATQGAITVGGTLATTNGGTGLTSFNANQVFYASSTSAIAQSANLQFSGTDLTVYGITVGRGAGAVSTNTAVGASALAANTTGANNVAVGSEAGLAITSGAANVAVGQQALRSNLTGSDNTALGRRSLYFTTGSNNTGLGSEALISNSTGTANVGVGAFALASNTTASNNTAVGYQAAYTNATGTSLTAVGYQALYSKNNSYGTALGYQAGFSTTTGTITAVGFEALYANTTGNKSTAVGHEALTSTTIGSNNAAFGHQAGFANTTGNDNSAFGAEAFSSNTTGSSNTAMGALALSTNTTGFGNTAIGTRALIDSTTSNYNTAVGFYASVSNTTGTANVSLGKQALFSSTTGSYNTAIGADALTSSATAANNTAVGYQAGYSLTSGQNSLFGTQAGYSSTSGTANSAFGYLALYTNSTGSNNVAIGQQALQLSTTASGNTAVGYQAANNTSTGTGLSALGLQALVSNTTGLNNTAVGYLALAFNSTASNNTAVGYQAGYSNTTGAGGLFVGYQAGYSNTTGIGNTYIAPQSGYSATTGSYNTFVGQGSAGASGSSVTTGGKNTIIGGYNGNQGGLDIRTASNYIVLSDGDGNPRAYWNGANATFGGTLAATIYYDSNNTAYYLDPASLSVLSRASMSGTGTASAPVLAISNTSASSFVHSVEAQAPNITSGQHNIVVVGQQSNTLNSGYFGYYWAGAASTNNFVTIGHWGNDDLLRVYGSGAVVATTDMRAPIFYDYNDTGYYIDPASTSNTALRMRGGALFGPNTTWGAYLSVGTNGHASGSYASVVATNGNLHLDAASGYDTYLNYYAGSNVYFGNGASGGIYAQIGSDGSFRSPIFYDYNNTAYYGDFASTSNINALSVATINNLNPAQGVWHTSAEGKQRFFFAANSTTYYRTGQNFVWRNNADSGVATLDANGWLRVASGGDNFSAAALQVSPTTPTGVGALPAGVTGIMDSSGNNYLLFRNTADNATYSGIAFQDNNMGGYVIFGNYGATPSDQIAIAGYGGGILQYGTADSINPSARTTVASWNSTGLQINNGDMRAPIFYDSDNTAYYGDFASTSNLNRLLIQPRIDNYYVGNVSGTDPVSNWQSLTDTVGQFIVSQFNNITSGAFTNYPTSVYTYGSVISTRTTNHSFQLYTSHTGDITYKTQWNNDNYSGWLYPMVYGRTNGAGGAVYGTIFYDQNNTAYYGDFASISAVYGVAIRGDSSPSDTSNQLFLWGAGNSTTSAIGFKQNGAPFTNPTGSGDGYNTYLTMDTPGRGWVFREGVGGTNFNAAYTSGWILNNGIWQANASMRAPIFYDSDNTAYYIDPNTTATSINVRGEITNPSIWINDGDNYNAYNENIRLFNAPNGASVIAFSASGTSGTPTTSILGFSDRFEIRYNNDWQQRNFNGYVEAAGSFRAPIFYDSNNTGYYVDPASTSNLAGLTVANSISGYVNGAYFNNDSETQANITNRVTSGFWQYGGATTALGWPVNTGSWQHLLSCTHSNDSNYYAMQLAATFYDQGLFYRSTAGSGSTSWSRVALYGNNYGSSLYGTIFYDSDNTGYFVDPSSASNFNTIYINGTSANAFGSYWAGASGYPGYQFAGGNSRFGFSSTSGYIDVYTDGNYYGGIDLYGANRLVPLFDANQGGGALYSSIVYDSNNTAYYGDFAATGDSINVAGNINCGNAGSNTGLALYHGGGAGDYGRIRFYQAGSNNQTIHAFPTTWQGGTLSSTSAGAINLTGANGVTIGDWNTLTTNGHWFDKSGNAFSAVSMRAPIFYDRDDTGYYLNPNGSSSLNGGTFNATVNFTANTYSAFMYGSGSTAGSTTIGLQVFSTGGSGAIMAFHRGGYYAVNMGLDSDNVLRIGGWSASANLWQLDMSGNGYYLGSSRAPIFYDSNNTAYYGDLASSGLALIVNGNIECTARSASWAEGIRVNVPTSSTWGGIRFTRGASTGNWAIGFTALNSTDDLTFYSGTNSNIALNLDHSGNLIARGNVTAYGSPSDRRLKENIRPIEKALDTVLKLMGRTFDWKPGSHEHDMVGLRVDLGFIADEVKEVVPEMVREGNDGYLSIRDRGFAALLVEAIKEQQTQIEALRAELNALRAA